MAQQHSGRRRGLFGGFALGVLVAVAAALVVHHFSSTDRAPNANPGTQAGADQAGAAKQPVSGTLNTDAMPVEVEALRAEVKRLAGEGAALRATLETRFAGHEALRSTATKLGAQLAGATAALEAAASERDAAFNKVKHDLTVAQERARALQKSLDEATERLEASIKVLERKMQEAAALKTQVDALKKQLGADEGADNSGEGSHP